MLSPSFTLRRGVALAAVGQLVVGEPIDVIGIEMRASEVLRKGDLLLHHPFDTFAPVVELVRQAAADPSVLAIKQTIYLSLIHI